jgi:hypothetical protein
MKSRNLKIAVNCVCIVFVLCSCNLRSNEDANKSLSNREKERYAEAACACPIEKIDQIVSNIDSKTQQFLDTFSFGGAASVELMAKRFGLIKGGLNFANVKEVGSEASKIYIGSSDFSGNPMIVELAILRNLYCATFITYCQQDKKEEAENEIVEFKKYMLAKLKTAKEEKVEPIKKAKPLKLKIIHGSNCKNIYIDNKLVSQIPEESNLDAKTFEVAKGKHLITIEYYSGRTKNKNINLQNDATISHISF